MKHRYLEIAGTPSVQAVQAEHGSRAAYARMEDGPVVHDRLGPDEQAFIAGRDGFYLGTVSSTGWPYIQFRGGPPGFLQVLDERHLAWADLRGNRQYISTGNLADNDRVSLFLMDYARQERLKLFGRASVQPAPAGAGPAVERLVVVAVEAFDWNCHQHITPRFTAAEWQDRERRSRA